MTRLAITIISAVIMFQLTGCYTQPNPAERPQKIKIQLTPEEQQMLELQKQIDAKFSDPQPHFQLGQLYRNQGKWEKAEIQYNLALRFDPGHKYAQAAMVKLNKMTNNEPKSQLLADIYINQAADSAEALLLLGNSFQKEDLQDYAFICYDKALNLAPNSAVLHRQLGYYYKRKGDDIRAEQAFKKSIQLDPYNAQAASELGKMGVAVEVQRKTQTPENAETQQTQPQQ